MNIYIYALHTTLQLYIVIKNIYLSDWIYKEKRDDEMKKTK